MYGGKNLKLICNFFKILTICAPHPANLLWAPPPDFPFQHIVILYTSYIHVVIKPLNYSSWNHIIKSNFNPCVSWDKPWHHSSLQSLTCGHHKYKQQFSHDMHLVTILKGLKFPLNMSIWKKMANRWSKWKPTSRIYKVFFIFLEVCTPGIIIIFRILETQLNQS